MTDEDRPVDTSGYFLIDPYQRFIETEGVPIVEDYAVDCLTLPLEPWSRLGGLGAYVHLTGRGDFASCYVAEIPAGGQLNPERHLYDELIYVHQGRGTTTLELPGGDKHSFEWGPHSMFAIPLNAAHQLFNAAGSEPVRFDAITNLPIILNLFHNVDFVFDNSTVFSERFGEERYLRGEGKFLPVKPGRHQWETNFVPDLTTFALPEWEARGAGGRNITFALADSPMHCHISEFASGTYKKGHRHGAGAHIVLVSGHGYSLLWQEGQDPLNTVRVDWKVGTLFAPPEGPTYHQHFNTSTESARYFVRSGAGGGRYPLTQARIDGYKAMDLSVKEGGNQIEYGDENPGILPLFEAEMAKHGGKSTMREFLGRP